MNILPRPIATVLLASLMAASLALLIPIPASWHGSWSGFYLPLLNSLFFTGIYCGVSWMFIRSLDVYKAKLRRAYHLVVAGILLVALGVVQFPIMDAFNLWASPWVSSGGLGMPFLLAGIIMYAGIRSLARLMGIRKWPTTFAFAIPLVIAGTIISTQLPHVQTGLAEIPFDISIAVIAWNLLFFGLATYIALQVAKNTGAHYKTTMIWLFIALSLNFVIDVVVIINFLADSLAVWGNVALNVLNTLTALAYLQTSYMFWKTKDY
jgi:hypothetical protein